MKKLTLKTRFSPSPTGQLHLGSARTALFNFLLAYQQKNIDQESRFLLRIEDTDKARSTTEFSALLAQDLQWLGLRWDEGPFFQSDRQAVYQQYYQQLEANQLAYPCFCTDEQLVFSRKQQLSLKQPPRYAGTCTVLSPQEIQAKKAQGMKAALRFKVPVNQEIFFEDGIKGLQKCDTDDIGDFIIRRSDGSAAFFFCNAVDDALMGVTEVIRGEDHLTNTPRQILILKALGLTIPHYSHTALIMDLQGNKLSKREQSASVDSLRAQGYLPIAINNYLARLGHHYAQTHLMTLDVLAQYFAIQHMSKTPAHFDEAQLLHWQKLAVMALSRADFWAWIIGYEQSIQCLVPADKHRLFVELIQPNVILPGEAKKWAEIFYLPFQDKQNKQISMNIQQFSYCIQTATQIIQEMPEVNRENYTVIINQLLEKTLLKSKTIFQCLRLALTGQLKGPELAGICALLGKQGLLDKLAVYI